MPYIQYDSLNYESAVFPREYGMGGAIFPREYGMGGAIFPREYGMGGAIFPIENGGAKFTGGVPISLGNLAWGCHIPWGAKYPVTPVRPKKFQATYTAERKFEVRVILSVRISK